MLKITNVSPCTVDIKKRKKACADKWLWNIRWVRWWFPVDRPEAFLKKTLLFIPEKNWQISECEDDVTNEKKQPTWCALRARDCRILLFGKSILEGSRQWKVTPMWDTDTYDEKTEGARITSITQVTIPLTTFYKLHETLGVCIVFDRSKWRKSVMFHRVDIKNRKSMRRQYVITNVSPYRYQTEKKPV